MMDTTLRKNIIIRLKEEIPELSKGLRSVAKYIIDHPSNFGLDTIRETARKSGVSAYTVIRLAERMGFASYEEMREPFRHSLVSVESGENQFVWLEQLYKGGKPEYTQATAARNSMTIVQRSLSTLDSACMQRVVTMLLNAHNVYLTAFRASYAMAFYFHYVGRMVLPSLQIIPRHMSSSVDDLHSAKEGDVIMAIMISPYSRETIEACQFAHGKGLKLILISDSEIVSPEFSADETLIASTLTTHRFSCYAGVMAIIETLLSMLVDQGGETAQARISSYERLRKESNAYWSTCNLDNE